MDMDGLPKTPSSGHEAKRIKKKILVVDDDKDCREILKDILEDEDLGYEVFMAKNGEEARNIVRQENPDAITMDGNLVGETGFQIADSLREMGSIAPIVMSSSDDLAYEGKKGVRKPATKKAFEDYFNELFPKEKKPQSTPGQK